MMKSSEVRRPILALAITMLICGAGLSGCVGATRLPARSRGPAGETFQKEELDLAFLEESGTRREEVLRRLSPIDTTYSNPRLFWGRWSDSKWGYWWFVAGETGAAGDAKRIWHIHNLLISFDEDGAVQKKMLIDDEPALWRELHVQVAKAPALDLPKDIPLASNRCCGVNYLRLTADSLQVARSRGKNRTMEISPLKIVRISHNAVLDKGSRVGMSCHTLHFAEKTAFGRNVRFCANAPSVAEVFQYVGEHGPKDLAWE